MQILLPKTFEPLTIPWEQMGCDHQVYEIIDSMWKYLKLLNSHGWFEDGSHIGVNRVLIETSLEVIARRYGGLDISVYGDGHEYRVYFRIRIDGIMHSRRFQF